MRGDVSQGLLDTNILILWRSIDTAVLPDEMAISAVTLAELSSGVHLVSDDAAGERAKRLEVLQRVEHEFDPIPFGAEAARAFGRLTAAVRDAGRAPRRRIADLMIAAVAAVEGLPLYTTNPQDFRGLEKTIELVPVPRPQ
ncbi:MAG TPA: type II toxin-antitoxin system VapC family toxin [Candidatus Ruania gallistercoris]|uniref:Ribonuclease VapC n=1 Tax=Candidatus Ruania gallistercoris TaxID=2838746 RepID=A0A9D2J5V1_9MICO|nr:type II toxin-antitoxin system VapC family toxin [Candidatus Ruania gallistercoris]